MRVTGSVHIIIFNPASQLIVSHRLRQASVHEICPGCVISCLYPVLPYGHFYLGPTILTQTICLGPTILTQTIFRGHHLFDPGNLPGFTCLILFLVIIVWHRWFIGSAQSTLCRLIRHAGRKENWGYSFSWDHSPTRLPYGNIVEFVQIKVNV